MCEDCRREKTPLQPPPPPLIPASSQPPPNIHPPPQVCQLHRLTIIVISSSSRRSDEVEIKQPATTQLLPQAIFDPVGSTACGGGSVHPSEITAGRHCTGSIVYIHGERQGVPWRRRRRERRPAAAGRRLLHVRRQRPPGRALPLLRLLRPLPTHVRSSSTHPPTTTLSIQLLLFI